jgi:hypothetical protein
MLAMVLSSHAGDGTAEAMLAVAQCRCLVMLAMTMVLSSLAGDDAIESCWRCSCQGDVNRGVMSLPSHTDDGTVKATSSIVKDTLVMACCRVMLAMALPRLTLLVVLPTIKLT